ncbi:hypothetical protein FNF27_04429 [Cafeteria roenbergensis]|uniref:Uncharacterized protein n=1 Tax=Cafeteria roenbergensis TaxID=33653 RepID=A0A5A8E8C0_CAFRO|nr:hypothetical protein FNF27_04429 [Cafeteria roenbergensis]
MEGVAMMATAPDGYSTMMRDGELAARSQVDDFGGPLSAGGEYTPGVARTPRPAGYASGTPSSGHSGPGGASTARATAVQGSGPQTRTGSGMTTLPVLTGGSEGVQARASTPGTAARRIDFDSSMAQQQQQQQQQQQRRRASLGRRRRRSSLRGAAPSAARGPVVEDIGEQLV